MLVKLLILRFLEESGIIGVVVEYVDIDRNTSGESDSLGNT
jgi:hypothetical protein